MCELITQYHRLTSAAQFNNKNFMRLFEEQVKKTPYNEAVIFNDERITYNELNEKANCFAKQLVSFGLKQGKVVAVLLDRNINTIISVLAILKTGAAYLPIEPEDPSERIHFILKDCQASLIITERSFLSVVSSCLTILNERPYVVITNNVVFSGQQDASLVVHFNNDSIIYIIYTSGSTGKPKGVMVTHRNVINYIHWFSYSFNFDERKVIDFSSPLAFDFSVTCTLLPLMQGGCISIGTKACKSDPHTYLQYLNNNKVTHVKLTPSYFRVLVNSVADIKVKLPDLSWVILGGEPIIKNDVKQWLDLFPHQCVVNEYGPTETTVATSAYTVTKDNIDKYVDIIPIGKPALNSHFYVLDSEKNPVDINTIGELYIGGDSVSKGYLNQPKLTKKCFIENKFAKFGQGNLYKTGDLVRQLSDGNIEYIGRIDSQVKIRGFRIDLNEIEYCLLKHPFIQQAVATVKQRNSGFVLIAYVVLKKSNDSLVSQTFRSILKQWLPEYMIPNQFFILRQLPLTANGKIDKAALSPPLPDNTRAIIPPCNFIEESIRNIFAQVLQQEDHLISVEDDFFAIGGDSLQAMQVILKCREVLNIEFPAHFLFKRATIAGLCEQIDQYTLREMAKLPPIKAIGLGDRCKRHPLSFAQQRLWFLHQLQKNSTNYNVFLALKLSGPLNCKALELAFVSLIHQHESLRTQFILEEGQVYQVVLSRESIEFSLVVESFIESPESELLEEAYCEAKKTFNLEQAPLFRARLLQEDQEEYVLFISCHHIIIDGTSIHLLFQALSRWYAHYAHKGTLPEKPILDYLDFTLWQRHWLSHSSVLAKQKSYWLEQLKELPPLELLPDYRRPREPSYQGKRYAFKINHKLTKQLHQLAEATSTTLFVTLFTGFSIVLSRYTQQDDISIGTPNASRHYPGLESMIGFFINLLILRCKLVDSMSVLSLLHENHKTLANALAHQDIPFEQIVEALHPDRESITTPLCSILFVFQNYAHEPLDLGEVKAKRIFSDNNALLFGDYESSKFDLTLYLQENELELEGLIEFNTDLFEQDTIVRIVNHFQNVLLAMVANPSHAIQTLPLLTEDEKRDLLYKWNNTQFPYPSYSTLTQLLTIQTTQTPNRVAIVFENQSLTYSELQQMVDRLAAYLLSQGIKSGSLVAVCLERNLYMPIALLSILKAGAAYVPIDPDAPLERIEEIIQSSKAERILTHTKHLSWLKTIELDNKDVLTIEDFENERIEIRESIDYSKPNELAYVLFTSGTTGQPKGVAIEHHSLINFLFAMQKELQLTADDRFLALTPITFDIAGLELYLPLVIGAQCLLLDKVTASNGGLLHRVLQTRPITVMQATPATWYLLLQSGWKGNNQMKVLSGGEALSHALGRQLLNAVGRFWNVYGPTETTIWSTIEKVDAIDENLTPSLISIGKPIANTRAYVLDKYKQLSAIGCAGELYLAGDGLAREYLHQPDLTEKCFVSPPLQEIKESRLYKTGDRVRRTSDGRLEYLGRSDNQVKIRGFRIELSAIENQILNNPLISQAIVTIHGDSLENKRIDAYIVLNKNNSIALHETLQTEQINYWKKIYQETYVQASCKQIGLITAGWVSSYTQQEMLKTDMQTWVDTTIQRILALHPKHVLEIGCGSGMLLLRLASQCESYCGSDMTEAGLVHIQEQLDSLKISTPIRLVNRAANVFEFEELTTYDTIVINSVVQYFPNIDYLINVLEGAIDCVAPGGQVFIGDVRSLEHLEAFCAAVQLSKAAAQTSYNSWQVYTKKQMEQEEELVISPEFFRLFAASHPRISHLSFQLKQGDVINEVTQFRYDVVLYIEHHRRPILEYSELNWLEKLWSLDEIKTYLEGEAAPAVFVLRNVPNYRLLGIANLLAFTPMDPEESVLTHLSKKMLCSCPDEAPLLNFNDLWPLSELVPYEVEMMWSNTSSLTAIDVIFRHRLKGFTSNTREDARPSSPMIRWVSLANNPIKYKKQQRILLNLRKELQEKLPSYMIPASFTILDTIPLTPNGKIDYNALPPVQALFDYQAIAPENNIQQYLILFWKQLLGVDSLNISDSFFDKGGHSLLAVQLMADIQSTFNLDLSLSTLFIAPTIEKLSAIIERHLTPLKM